MLEATLSPGTCAPVRERTAALPGEARGLVFAAGGKRLIDGIDLKIAAGPATVIMGPNGAGKSLLVRLLHGLIAPSDGEVLWGGRHHDETTRKHQAMVFQTPVLLRRSVAANLDFVLKLHGSLDPARRDALLDLADLSGRGRQPARQLSMGEQQRLAMVRALAPDPDVLFLDEPTASLDPASQARIELMMRTAQTRGTKIVLVTHDLGQAKRLAGEVVFLHRGRVCEQTPAARFFDAPQSREAADYLDGAILL